MSEICVLIVAHDEHAWRQRAGRRDQQGQCRGRAEAGCPRSAEEKARRRSQEPESKTNK